jgi:hypothetical protein
MILLRLGRLSEAQRYFERVIQSPPFYQDEDRRPIWRHSDDRAMARALLARALWLRAFPERAHHEAQTSLGEVRGSDHQLTMWTAKPSTNWWRSIGITDPGPS